VDEGYARFQALLGWLSEPEARPYQAWISEAEPRMLAVAAQLTARWRE
jgi:hypothetical protein